MALSAVPLFVPGIPGGPEVLVVLLIVVLLFGSKKIPKLARSSGEAIGEFKKGREQVEQELNEIKDTAEEEVQTAADPEADLAADGASEPSTTHGGPAGGDPAPDAEVDASADADADAQPSTDDES
jgi:sec-independent protein translocase protein TatA